MSAEIICKQPSEYLPVVTFTPIPVAGSSANSSVVIDALTYKKVDVSGSSFNYSVSQAVPQFQPDWALTSDTPAICTVSGNSITRVSNGVGKVRVTGPNGIAVPYELNFTSTTSTSYVWTGFNGASISYSLCSPTISLLQASKDKNYYAATYPLSSTPTAPFLRNSNCWVASMNLTGSPIATSMFGPRYASNSGALITKRHWVGVRHWGSGNDNMGPGAQLYFADSAGNVYVRTVLQRYLHPTKDIIVSLLDSDLPAAITPFKFAGSGMFDFPNKRAYGIGWKIHQGKFVTPAIFDNVQSPQVANQSVTTESISWADLADGIAAQLTDSAHILYPVRNLLQQAITGDSGGAIGGYYNGETFLVSLFTGPQSGTLYSSVIAPEINSIIAGLDAAQGISTGYTVGVLTIP